MAKRKENFTEKPSIISDDDVNESLEEMLEETKLEKFGKVILVLENEIVLDVGGNGTRIPKTNKNKDAKIGDVIKFE